MIKFVFGRFPRFKGGKKESRVDADWEFMDRMIMFVISDNMKGDSEKQFIYLSQENQSQYSSIIGEKRASKSSSPFPQQREQIFPSEYSPIVHQKMSADDQAEENSNQILNQSSIKLLYQAMEKQNYFMQSLSYMRDGIIQHQIVNHISHQGEKFQRLNFAMVKQYTQNRIDKMLKNKRLKKNWSHQDLKILVWIVAKYCQKKRIKDVYAGIEQKDWDEISSIIPGTTSEMCMFKWLGLRKSKIRDQRWQKSEQQFLEDLVKNYGEKSWGIISKQLFYQNTNKNKVYRSGKQCREHWNCFLNPHIKKGNWNVQQDTLLAKLVFDAKGKKHWAKMVGQFGGRTENALKNRYAIIVERERGLLDPTESQKLSQMEVLQKFIQKRYMEECIRENSPNSQKQNDHYLRSSLGTATISKTMETLQQSVKIKDERQQEQQYQLHQKNQEKEIQQQMKEISVNDEGDDEEINEVNISEIKIVNLDGEELEKLKGNLATKKLIVARQSKEGVLLLDRKSATYMNKKTEQDS